MRATYARVPKLITLPRVAPVEAPSRPANPYAVSNPYATTVNPYRTANPYTARSNPYGGGSGKPPGGPRSPYAASPYGPKRPRDGANRSGSKPNFVHHTVVVIPPNRAARRSRYALDYDTCLRIWADFNECSLEPDVLEAGSGLDFTRLGEYAANVDHRNEYCPFDQDGTFAWHGDYFEQEEIPSGCPDFHDVDAEWLNPGQPAWAIEDHVYGEWKRYELEEELLPEEIQVLIFERTRQNSPALEGRYVVTRVVSHAWSGSDRPADAPPNMTGWHEVFVAPCDSEWNLI